MTDIEDIERNNIMNMKKYNIIREIDKHDNYELISNNPCDTSTFFHKNYNTMDELELRSIYNKIVPIQKIKSELLKHELLNFNIEMCDNMTLEQFKKQAMKLLYRYTCKAGGFNLDDTMWTCYSSKSKSTDYNIKTYEILFENTIDRENYDNEIKEFMNKIINVLNELSKNIKVEIDHKTTGNIRSILLWCVDIDQCDLENLDKTLEQSLDGSLEQNN